MILSIGDRSFLNEELISLLNQKQVSTLAQASIERDHVTFAEVWRRSEDMELTWDHATYWYNFTVELSRAGITLNEDAKDLLMWTGGDSSRKFTVKNCYNAILSTRALLNWRGWKVKLWKWRVQLKIMLFFWLATDNMILTWDILQKKGWVGPSMCHLCKDYSEDNAHLFIRCSFTKSVWEKCALVLNSNFY
jgi:hypothetical protein